MSLKEFKTIRITKETYDRLAKLGDLSESFDSVIVDLLDNQKPQESIKKKKLEGTGGLHT